MHKHGVQGGFGLLAIAVACIVSLAASGVASATGDANTSACPFEAESSPGFRTYLPDCRAYEMVTPSYKEGAGLQEKSLFLVSPDGMHLIGASIGSFANAENDRIQGFGFGATYEFTRAASGWQTTALDPPASLYPEGYLFDASTDLASSLWFLHPSSAPSTSAYGLYIRNSEGALTRIGPGASSLGPGAEPANTVYVGASDDLHHVLFATSSSLAKLWPGDTTVEPGVSLYEYVGTENAEPTLVGVSNEGRLEGHAYVNEGAKLISQCGTVLGGHEGRTSDTTMYNAISEDGGTVFFTSLGQVQGEACIDRNAELQECEESRDESRALCETELGSPLVAPAQSEVYARIDGAETVDVSEPPLSIPGRACTAICASDEESEAARREGIFEGASQDGSKVFFRTEQPLIDADTDTSSDLYELELQGSTATRLVMVSKGGEGDATPGSGAEVQGVASISEDGSHVYFVARGVLTTSQNGEGAEAQAGQDNLYVFDTETEETRFVATLSSEDAEVWSHGDGSVQATPDGRFLVFPSQADITKNDKSGSGAAQLFEYDAQTGGLVRISVGQNGSYLCPSTEGVEEGYNCDGNTNNEADSPKIATHSYSSQDRPTGIASSLTLSENGSYVVFQSMNSLTPQAIEGDMNVYEYHDGNVYLISDGHDASMLINSPAVELVGLDASGEDVFFMTADALVPQDTNTQQDVYDARVDGGFPAPVSPAECEGEACQNSLSATPSPLTAGSTTIGGGGNVAQVAPKPVVKALTRAQKLSKALKACRVKHSKRKRAGCEARAKKRYGPKRHGSRPNAKKTNRRAS